MKHRTALVTAVSIAGVLVAGVSAVGANVGILASAGSDGIGAATPTTTPVSVPSLDGTTATARAAGELLAYEVDGVGVVTIERTGEGISVAGIDAPGWARETSDDDGEIRVAFVQGDTRLVFLAVLVGGEVEVSVTDETPTPYVDDDEDDDHDEDEDHEDDEHERDDD